ncbi:MAG: hypothetical protein M0P31_18740 [Solirubrobacteraceae bacterium]|nr:hypothetical protein [Solirubrobacteraceae bacterium]
MALHSIYTYKPPARMPPPAQDLSVRVVAKLRSQASGVADDMLSRARDGFPTQTGLTARSFRTRTTESARGYTVTLANDGSRAYIVRFLERGTGIHGPLNRRIPVGRRGFIPSAQLEPRGAGQRPQKAWTNALRRVKRVEQQAQQDMAAAWNDVVRDVR